MAEDQEEISMFRATCTRLLDNYTLALLGCEGNPMHPDLVQARKMLVAYLASVDNILKETGKWVKKHNKNYDEDTTWH